MEFCFPGLTYRLQCILNNEKNSLYKLSARNVPENKMKQTERAYYEQNY